MSGKKGAWIWEPLQAQAESPSFLEHPVWLPGASPQELLGLPGGDHIQEVSRYLCDVMRVMTRAFPKKNVCW